jgi:type VI protein secretion system component Hcp
MALPGSAFAGGKSRGGGTPSESMSLNYGKVEHTYSQQGASKKTGSKTGKAQLHDLSITKKTDKASPN